MGQGCYKYIHIVNVVGIQITKTLEPLVTFSTIDDDILVDGEQYVNNEMHFDLT